MKLSRAKIFERLFNGKSPVFHANESINNEYLERLCRNGEFERLIVAAVKCKAMDEYMRFCFQETFDKGEQAIEPFECDDLSMIAKRLKSLANAESMLCREMKELPAKERGNERFEWMLTYTHRSCYECARVFKKLALSSPYAKNNGNSQCAMLIKILRETNFD